MKWLQESACVIGSCHDQVSGDRSQTLLLALRGRCLLRCAGESSGPEVRDPGLGEGEEVLDLAEHDRALLAGDALDVGGAGQGDEVRPLGVLAGCPGC